VAGIAMLRLLLSLLARGATLLTGLVVAGLLLLVACALFLFVSALIVLCTGMLRIRHL
jgi:hypothetical protein